MPMPKPKDGESMDDFMSRFMSDPVMVEEYPDEKQRAAIANQQWSDKETKKFTEQTYDIDAVEIFEAGKWNGDKYTEKDLDDIVESFNAIGDKIKPYVKLGHDNKQQLLQTDGYPAAGWITALSRVGKKLFARFSNIPEKIYNLIKNRAYGRVSSEIYWNLKEGDNSYRRVLKAVALLGADTPAVTTLNDFINLYTNEITFDSIKLCTERKDIMEEQDIKVYTDKITELEEKLKASAERMAENDKRIEEFEKERVAAYEKDVAAFLDSSVSQGKISPAQVELIKPLCSQSLHKYSEGEKSAFELVKMFIDTMQTIPMGEQAQHVEVDKSAEDKPEGDKLNEKVLAYMKEHQGVKYADAYSIVVSE